MSNVLCNEVEERFLDHLRERSMEAEEVKVLVLSLPAFMPQSALLLERGIALLQCVQVNVDRKVTIYSRVLRS